MARRCRCLVSFPLAGAAAAGFTCITGRCAARCTCFSPQTTQTQSDPVQSRIRGPRQASVPLSRSTVRESGFLSDCCHQKNPPPKKTKVLL
ncbi:hypothetical protein LX36DRAFT_658460 [Colletotrichum falcatum]|nr:hypothetical protein LX36DRAFT_658460 [Colletotrichum falcatum]